LIRPRKLDDESEPAEKGGIHALPHVGGQDRQAIIGLHALKQICYFYICITVMSVLYFTSLPEERLRLVDQDRRARALRVGEHTVDVLLGIADVLAHDPRQVEAQELHAQSAGDSDGGHRLPHSRRAKEERHDAAAATQLVAASHL